MVLATFAETKVARLPGTKPRQPEIGKDASIKPRSSSRKILSLLLLAETKNIVDLHASMEHIHAHENDNLGRSERATAGALAQCQTMAIFQSAKPMTVI